MKWMFYLGILHRTELCCDLLHLLKCFCQRQVCQALHSINSFVFVVAVVPRLTVIASWMFIAA